LTLTLIDRLTRRFSSFDSRLSRFARPTTRIAVSEVYDLIESKLALGSTVQARALTELVWTSFPTDLHANALLGQALLKLQEWTEACARLEYVLSLDPEDATAHTGVGIAYCAVDKTREAIRSFERASALNPDDTEVRDRLEQLRPAGHAEHSTDCPLLADIRELIAQGDLEAALQGVERRRRKIPGDLNLALLRAEALWRLGRMTETEKACRTILARLPLALAPRLIIGDIVASDPNRAEAGRDLIQQAQDDDLAGIVARRLFGDTDASPSAAAEWLVDVPTELLVVNADRPMPAIEIPELPEVEEEPQANGAEDLPIESGETTSIDETHWAPSHEAAQTVDNALTAGIAVGRPCLIGICVRQAIIDRYGLDGLERLDRRLKAVARELNLIGLTFEVAFVDDAASMAAFEVLPVRNRRADEIRAAIGDLARQILDGSRALARRGDGAVLLIGGDDVVPYFRIVNPADDDDEEILTDTPYGATTEGSWLLPELPIGRLIDGYAGNLGLLLRQLDNLIEARREALIQPIGRGVLRAGRVALGAIGIGRSRSSALACVAADREAVGALVVGAIPPGGLVQSCPPTEPGSFDLRWLAEHRCLFFDVTGTRDGDQWFGRPIRNPETGAWEAPVAFSADHLAEAHLRSPIVFTTAGYAARFATGEPAGSLVQRFLSDGTAALVASSASTYGTSAPPLAGADLLASLFWRHVQEGNPVGEALRLARHSFAQIELERQGYLDGDDQKTLLEFSVYGDPLFRVFDDIGNLDEATADTLVGPADCLCKDASTESRTPALDRRFAREALQFMTAQHPELEAGAIRVQRRAACGGECGQPLHSGTGRPAEEGVTSFVTARAAIRAADSTDPGLIRIARATLDDDGQVVKLVVSR
jgi:tetratricopeptide (TPR) repeat protein